MDGRISDFLKMQHELAETKGWLDSRTPESAPFSLLWSIDELGEAIAIIKKKGAQGIMENPSVREHFVEELADTFMYLFDMMESYQITSEEFTAAYVKKFEKNLGRNWHENSTMYEKCEEQLVIFDLSDSLELTARQVEVLSRTDLKLAALSTKKLDESLSSRDLDPELFAAALSGDDIAKLITYAASKLEIEPSHAVFCTDSAENAVSAEALGLTCAAFRCTDVPDSVKVINDFDELQDFLRTSPDKAL